MKFLIVLVIAIIAVELEGYEEEGCLRRCGIKVDGYKRFATCHCCPIGT